MKGQGRKPIIQRADRIAYVLGRKLTRQTDVHAMHDQILRAMTGAVDAEVGALALYVPEDASLQIVSTIGYPRPIDENLRLNSRRGVIGPVYASGLVLRES